MIKKLALCLAITSCTHSRGVVVAEEDNLKTIKVFTGSWAEDGLYKSAFEDGADEACPQGYRLVERGRKPSTMQHVDRHEFFWVVECKESGGITK